MLTIIFETHATSEDNEAKLASGHFDVPLSLRGEQEARELGKRYRGKALAAVFCSDLHRSYRTAEIAFGTAVPIIKDPRLRELDYGDWTGRPSADVNTEKLNRISVPFPHGESYEQVVDRMKQFLEELLRDYDGKTILVIGHAATRHSLEHLINKVPLAQAIAHPFRWQPGWTYRLEKV